MSTPEQELKRLLHYGLNIPFYKPGDRENTDLYHSCVQCTIENLLADGKLTNPVNTIMKVFSDGYSAHPAMIVFTLAFCAKQNSNEQLREAAYKAVKTVCSSPENFFLFIKYATKLSPNKSIWGSGFRKVCKDWYLKKDVKTLAEIVGRQKRLHGWSHKDIIKLIHLKTSDEPARAAIIRYLLFGIKAAKKDLGENIEANEVLNYLQGVEDFRRLTDQNEASRNIEIHNFSLDHVPPHLVRFEEVWCALVGTMPLKTLLKNLERVGYMGFLRQNSHFVEKVTDALLNKNSTAECNVHPAEVYVALKSYETSSKFNVAENAKKIRRTENGSGEKKMGKVPPKPNDDIVRALWKLFASSCKLFLAPTGLRYFVTLDLKTFSPFDKCYRCPSVSPAEAAILISLCLLHADRNVSVRVGGLLGELVPVGLTSGMAVPEGVNKLYESGSSFLKYSAPLEWAMKKKEEYDVFVLITDSVHKNHNNVVKTLQNYREEMKIPNVKLVLVLLKCHFEPIWVKESKDPGLFVIGGFDENVPRLIEAFSRGAF